MHVGIDLGQPARCILLVQVAVGLKVDDQAVAGDGVKNREVSLLS
jgi:hypothetical protein